MILGNRPAHLLDTPSLTTRQTPAVSLSPQQIEDRLRQKRSSGYVKAMSRLDAGGHVHNQSALNALLDAIRTEFPDLELLPLGVVSRCYLGEPFEVHTLDWTGNIIQHYKTYETLPASLERARTLALHPDYAFVEVYTDKLIAVTESGDTSVIRN
ncbi:MAG: hypothetical protein LBQ81_07975 [Zoogloeaceae bacterium]|nr:hypothetical protein [Zoogloeaceae bacterium]